MARKASAICRRNEIRDTGGSYRFVGLDSVPDDRVLYNLATIARRLESSLPVYMKTPSEERNWTVGPTREGSCYEPLSGLKPEDLRDPPRENDEKYAGDD